MHAVSKQDQQHRKPLEWHNEATFTSGRVIAQIQVAFGHRGKLFSVRFGRDNPKSPERLTPFLEPKDIAALREVIDEADDYLHNAMTGALQDRFGK